jgi:hypothetical protein
MSSIKRDVKKKAPPRPEEKIFCLEIQPTVDRCLVNVHANILFLFHDGARFREVIRTITTYRKVGAFLYCV